MVTDVGTKRQGKAVVDRSFDKVHGTCPVCLRRKRLHSGRIETHVAPGGRQYCKGSRSAPTTEPSINGIVGGRGTHEARLEELRRQSRVFGDAGVLMTAEPTAQERYEAGAGVRYTR